MRRDEIGQCLQLMLHSDHLLLHRPHGLRRCSVHRLCIHFALGRRQNQPSAAAKAVPKGGFVPVGFTFVAQGTYGQILALLYHLENGQHFCRVLSASVTKGANSGPGSDLLTLNLSLELLGLQQ